MPLHGGREFGTRRLARSISDLIPVSLYTVVQPADLAGHLLSISHDPSTNRSMATALDVDLAVEGVPAVPDLAAIPKAPRGHGARNPVNIPIEAGVQLELPRSMRRPVPLAGIVSAVRKVLEGMV